MIVSSFNIRGLGSRVKRRKIREIVQAENLDFLALQETKMEVISTNFVHTLWGNSNCDSAFLPAVGSSGGILSIWNKVVYSLVFTFVGDGFVGVCLDNIGSNGVVQRCYLVNVYAKCNLRDKRRLWADILMSKRGFGEGCWCVMGDFNSVRDSDERRGVGQNHLGASSSEMVLFDAFINNLEMVDLPLVGRNFTWFHPNGVSMSRLDRILISPSWFDIWGEPNVWVLNRDVADHCPLVLRYNNFDWGPKPFRFNNFLLLNKDFKEVVSKAWENQHFEGWMRFVLKDRLKDLKSIIKDWKAGNYGVLEEKKKLVTVEILNLDLKSETMGLEEGEVIRRKKLFEDL
jgi:hypothetical protein